MHSNHRKVALPQQIVAGLPSGGRVVQVGGVAVIATTSALYKTAGRSAIESSQTSD